METKTNGDMQEMRKSIFYVMLFIMMFCLLPQHLWARTGYVTDRLILNFRQEPNNTSAVIKALTSDTPVFILEEKNEFYKIELDSKETGWVEKKFIVFEPPKTLILEQLVQENTILKDKISNLSGPENKTQQTDPSSPKKDDMNSTDPDQTNEKIQALVQENQMVQQKNQALSREVELLRGKNKGPLKTGMIKWFLSGVGVLLIGWMIGRSVSFKKRKSNSLY